MFRAPGNYITITFDAAGRIADRGLGFGLFSQVAKDIQDRASGDHRGYDLSGALIVAPSFLPGELVQVVSDALVLRLSPALCKTLLPHERAAWGRGA